MESKDCNDKENNEKEKCDENEGSTRNQKCKIKAM